MFTTYAALEFPPAPSKYLVKKFPEASAEVGSANPEPQRQGSNPVHLGGLVLASTGHQADTSQVLLTTSNFTQDPV